MYYFSVKLTKLLNNIYLLIKKLLYTINGLIEKNSISDLKTIQLIANDYIENKKKLILKM